MLEKQQELFVQSYNLEGHDVTCKLCDISLRYHKEAPKLSIGVLQEG